MIPALDLEWASFLMSDDGAGIVVIIAIMDNLSTHKSKQTTRNQTATPFQWTYTGKVLGA